MKLIKTLFIIFFVSLLVSCEKKESDFIMPDSIEIRHIYRDKAEWTRLEVEEGYLPFNDINLQLGPIYKLSIWEKETDFLVYEVETRGNGVRLDLDYNTNYYSRVVARYSESDILESPTKYFKTRLHHDDGATLYTQHEVDSFGSLNIQIVERYLDLRNDDLDPIVDLSPLNGIYEIDDLTIYCDHVQSIDGFDSLRKAYLISIGGMSNLESITGFKSLDSVSDFNVFGNPSLQSISGFNNLIYIGYWGLDVDDNDLLYSIDGFERLNHIKGDFIVERNDSFNDWCGFQNFFINGYLGGLYEVEDNLYNPTIEEIINMDCDK